MRRPSPYALAALCLALAPCASAQSRSPRDPGVADYHSPASGRVTLELASTGVPQTVVLLRRASPGSTFADGRPRRWVGSATCTTPCRVFVPSGSIFLRARGPGVRGVEMDLDVPEGGAAVSLRAPSAALFNIGTGFVAIGSTVVLATMAVAASRQGISSTSDGEGLDAGSALAAVGVGVALLAAGIPLMVLHRTGVSSLTRPSVALGTVARGDGPAATARWVF